MEMSMCLGKKTKPSSQKTRMNINFFAPSNELSYGIHARNTMKALHLKGHTINLTPTMNDVSYQDIFVQTWLQNQKFFQMSNPSVMIFHAAFLSQFSGKPKIGFPVWEIDHFSEHELAMMKSCDFLLVTSSWGKDILEKKGFVTHVVNEGFDPNIYAPSIPWEHKLSMIKNHPIRFGHVGKWECRKSSQEIIQGFLLAVRQRHESTELVMHSLNPFMDSQQIINAIKKTIDPLSDNFYTESKNNIITFAADNWKIIFPLERLPNEESMAEFYNKVHVGLFASRAEGWNLPLMEMIACGVPCITTDVTAQQEYLQQYPSLLKLTHLSLVPAYDGVWFRDPNTPARWFQPNPEELAQKITWCLDHPENVLALGPACQRSVSKFTWDAAATQLEKLIS